MSNNQSNNYNIKTTLNELNNEKKSFDSDNNNSLVAQEDDFESSDPSSPLIYKQNDELTIEKFEDLENEVRLNENLNDANLGEVKLDDEKKSFKVRIFFK